MKAQRSVRRLLPVLLLLAAHAGAEPPASIPNEEPSASSTSRNPSWRIEREGIAIELVTESLDAPAREAFQEGENVRFRFQVSDTTTGLPLSGLYPAAWMHRLKDGEKPSSAACEEKVEEFVGGSILYQADLDLNVYFVLALNHDATISVVDPLFGFGGSKLLALINLPGVGEDWALSADQSLLFVSTPESNRLVVADTVAWQVLRRFDPGPRPTRVAVQPDGAYLWVSVLGGVTAVRVRGLRESPGLPPRLTRITTGRRPHEIAFSDDSRFAFVTNHGDDTVSVIDVRSLAKVKDVTTGPGPVSVAYSPLAGAAYVSHEGDGRIVAIDGERHVVVADMETEPGLGQIRFAPDGRLGFAVNPKENRIDILDAAKNRIVQTGQMKEGPDQIAFSDNLAYVRHRDSEQVLMIPLGEVGARADSVPVIDFPGGQEPFGRTRRPSPAASIVQAPGDTAVLVANPADEMIYFYKEGMAAPMGGFQNYDRQPRAVLVVDRSLREATVEGTYETAARLTGPGRYEIAFFLDTPRLVHCFAAEVVANPELQRARREAEPVRVEALFEEVTTAAVGESVRLRFKLTDPHTGKAEPGHLDVQVLARRAGNWHRKLWAEEVGDGVYEISFEPPAPGSYRIQVECLSGRLQFHQSPTQILRVAAADDSERQGG